MDTRSERAIMEALEHNDPELRRGAQAHVRLRGHQSLDDRSIQRLLRDVNSKDLSMALRNTTEELKARVFKNIPSRAAQALRDDMAVAGPVRLRLVEARSGSSTRSGRRRPRSSTPRGDQDVLIWQKTGRRAPH